MRIAQTLAAILLMAITAILFAAPASAGGSASCSEYGYSAWEYWRFEPDTGGCSHMPGDAFMGGEETLLMIADGGREHDFEIHVTDSAGSPVSVSASCSGADCGSVQVNRPHAVVSCSGLCDITYDFDLNGAPVSIDLHADVMFQDFDAFATYGGGTTMVGVTSEATVTDPNQGYAQVRFRLDEPTTNPFVVPDINVWGGTLMSSYWQTDNILLADIQGEPGTVFVTLEEGAVAMREGTKNEAETAILDIPEPTPMVTLNALVQHEGENALIARYNARDDVDYQGHVPEVSGPSGLVRVSPDPFGGEIHIPLTGPGMVSLTLPRGFYADRYDYKSDPQGPVSFDASYGIALNALNAPDSAEPGALLTLTARSTTQESQGEVRFMAEGKVIGTAPIMDGAASIEATMPEGHTTFSAEVIEAGGIVQYGSAIATEVVAKKRPLDLGINAPTELTIGEQVSIDLHVSDPGFAGTLVFSTSDGQVMRELSAQTRQISFLPEKAGKITFQLAASGDSKFEKATAPALSRTISKRVASITLKATPGEAHPGDEIALTAKLSEYGIHSGRITALANGQVIHDAPVNGAPELRLTHQPKKAGEFTYELRLTGSDTHEDILSNAAKVLVSQISGALSLSANDTSPIVMDRVEITATMPEDHDGTLRILRDGHIVAEYADAKAGPHYSFEPSEPGTFTFVAELIGGARHADLRSEPVIIEVSRKTTALELETSADQAAPGDKILLTASIAPSDAAGFITFTANGADIGRQSLDANGKTSLHYQVGEEDIIFGARFAPATDQHEPAIAQDTKVMVSRALTALELVADREEVAPGDEITLTASFSNAPDTGLLTIFADQQEISRMTVDGRSSYEALAKISSTGVMKFHATLTQSQRFEPTQSKSLVIEASRIDSGITLDLEASTAHPGEKLQAIAILDPVPDTGKVSLIVDGSVVASLPASGRIEFMFKAPEAGDHAIEARFSGSERMQPATSNVEMLAVSKRSVAISLSADRETAVAGEILTLIARLDPSSATGEVLFFNGDAKIGSAKVANGTSTLDWTAVRGTAHLRARYEGDDSHDHVASQTLVLTIDPNTEEAFEEKAPMIQKAVEAETRRAAQARLRHHEWMMRDARTRLRGQNSVVSRSFMPLSYSGMLKADDDRAFAKGAFHGGGDMGGYRRYVYGAFDIAREEGYGTTFEFNGAVAWEKTFGENGLGGIYLGAEIGRTNLSNSFEGEIDSHGVNLGIYGAKRLAGDVVVDGFANIARLNHDIKLVDEDFTAEGSYASTSLQVGGAITGEHQLSSFTLAPQISAVHAANWAEDADMTAHGASGSSTVILEGASNHSTRITATPELIFPIGQSGMTELSFAPRAICQVEKTDSTTRGCGGGIGLGLDRGFAGGMGHFSADFEVEEVSGRRREMLRLDVTLDF